MITHERRRSNDRAQSPGQPIPRSRGAIALLCALAACGDQRDEPEPSGIDPATPPAEATPAAADGAPAGGAGTITLVTGDRVTLRRIAGRTAPQIEPGPGRAHIAFAIRERAGEVSVIPEDMEPLLAAGQLDGALFDVDRLLAEGYGDDQRDDLPLLVTGVPHGAGGLAMRGQLVATGVHVDRVLPGLGVMALRQPKRAASAALLQLTAPIGKAAAPIDRAATPPPRLWLDRKRELSLEQSTVQVGAPAAHSAGYTGAGVIVAVLDTGIDASHPDLAGKVVAAQSFIAGDDAPGDLQGHGTHVASIIAGSGAAAGGIRHGVAPGATLLDARVCGAGRACFDSAILAGMEWAVDHGARVVNLSLGGTDGPELDPLEQAINTLSAQHGTLFVAAAGNAGFSLRTVSSPSSADAALSVGSVNHADVRAASSGQGPRVSDNAIKPDLTAPGVGIAAARAAGTTLGTPLDALYTRASGTSMATPHVAGAAAVHQQQHPTWSGAQLKAALMAAAQPSAVLTVYQQGAGRLDLDRATRQRVTVEPASLSFGTAAFPHEDDLPITRVVRYHNAGAAPLTLSLEAELSSPTGAASPAGMVTIEPSAITLAPGGSTDVAITIDTRLDAPDGVYGGALIATAAASGGEPDLRLITPLGVERETEMYELAVSVLGQDGQPASAFLDLVGLSSGDEPSAGVELNAFVSEQAVLRLPAGTYFAFASLDDQPISLVAPRLMLSGATSLVLDGRQARSLELTLPDPDLRFVMGTWSFHDSESPTSRAIISPALHFTAELGAAAPAGEVHSLVSALFSNQDDSRTYNVAHIEADHILTGWKQSLRSHDLATIDAHYAGAAGQLVEKVSGAWPSVEGFMAGFATAPQAAPWRRTEHYYGPGFSWYVEAAEVYPYPNLPGVWVSTFELDALHDYQAGQRTRERWNRAPFGPAFPEGMLFSLTPDRNGAPKRWRDYLTLGPSLFSDQARPARHSSSVTVQERLRLFRDGELLRESTTGALGLIVQIPAERAEYRLEAEATRPAAQFELSTQVSAAWTFPAAAGADIVALPLPTLRFSPPLDDQHRSHAAALALPVHIERPLAAPATAIRDARVEVSFDDGASWRRVPLLRLGAYAIALVLHPPGATHVSLRGNARDDAGNSVEQTILRAYALAR